MTNYYVDYSSDGCPNNCAYCRDMGFSCIYYDDDSPLKKKPYTCCRCGKKLASSDTYEYRGYCACENCLDAVIEWYKHQHLD